MNDQAKAQAFAVDPADTETYWQPKPANGYAEVHISRRHHETLSDFESGVQVVAPGCYIREHAHSAHEEVIHVIEGNGTASIDGKETPIGPGCTLYLGPLRAHKITNTGSGPLRLFWVLMPGGLSEFFSEIGRPRTPGGAAPEPFERPADVAAIEQRTVYAPNPTPE